MSYTRPTQCDWMLANAPCSSERLVLKGERLFTVSEGPDELGHSIHTEYTMSVMGHNIPLVLTDRQFTASWRTDYLSTNPPGGVAVRNLDGSYWLIDCTEQTSQSIPSLTVSDKCSIEKSTLHYLDQRYGVCLYRYQKDELDMKVKSSELASFKTTQGSFIAHQAQIQTGDYTAKSTVEWRLVIDGAVKVLSHDETLLEPFGIKNDGSAFTEGFAAGFHPDPETRKIIVFPQPPSQSIPLSPEVVRLGFYDYGNLPGGESDLNRQDGGYKDMFYPEWCRNLQADPFWRYAADQRYNISWFHADKVQIFNYEPPEISVDPIPKGSFVRHSLVGDVYQFLINGTPVTSPDLTALIDSQLPDGMKTHGTTLYYPISII